MDQSTILQIKHGDKKAFEDTFHAYYSALCGFAMRFVRDPDEAEEVVQDTFVRIWQKREQISINHSLKSYLFQSVRNSCLNTLKHQVVVREYESDQQMYALREDMVDSVVTDELESKIKATIGLLPPERKKIFLMSRDEGLRYAEIAEKLNISVKTVENQIGRALKFLREELADFLVVLWIIYITNTGGWG